MRAGGELAKIKNRIRPVPALEAAALSLLAMVPLSACGSTDLSSLETRAVTGYVAANAFAPTGHSVSALPDGRFRVTATGNKFTPPGRLEKIALARAAEYGLEQNKKYFQTSAPQAVVRCRETEYIERGKRKKLPPQGVRVVEIDVAYANAQSDPSFRPVKGTSQEMKAELQAEVVPEEAKDAAAAEVKARCGA